MTHKDGAAELFFDEYRLLEHARGVCNDVRNAAPALTEDLETFVRGYEKLLRQTKKLVRISDNLERQLVQKRHDLEREQQTSVEMLAALIGIGKSLSAEKDHDALLRRILMLSEEVTAADSGSIILVEANAEGEKNLWDVVVDRVRAREWTLGTAESCTGGLVSELVTSSAGVSDCFRGGVVSYSDDVKVSILGVDRDSIATHGAVSESVARAMAEGCRHALGVEVAIALTGVAGPGGGTEDKPVGLVHYACALPTETVHRSHVFHGQRWQIRRLSAFAALDLARRELA